MLTNTLMCLAFRGNIHTDKKPQSGIVSVRETGVKDVELTTVKLTVTREELKNENPEAAFEKSSSRLNLPVDELILGILYRMINEQRNEKDAS